MRCETADVTRGAWIEVTTTRAEELVDITERLDALVREAGATDGILYVQTCHTTTGLLVNEAEPLLLDDLMARFAAWAPREETYAHDDLIRRTVNVGPAERVNGFAHCRAALLRTTETVLVAGGRLDLGRWQRVLLVEFDGPQRRRVAVRLLAPGRSGAQWSRRT